MPERDHDPIASTQLFRAFVQRDHSEPATRRRARLLVFTAILAVLVLGAVVGWLVAR